MRTKEIKKCIEKLDRKAWTKKLKDLNKHWPWLFLDIPLSSSFSLHLSRVRRRPLLLHDLFRMVINHSSLLLPFSPPFALRFFVFFFLRLTFIKMWYSFSYFMTLLLYIKYQIMWKNDEKCEIKRLQKLWKMEVDTFMQDKYASKST